MVLTIWSLFLENRFSPISQAFMIFLFFFWREGQEFHFGLIKLVAYLAHTDMLLKFLSISPNITRVCYVKYLGNMS